MIIEKTCFYRCAVILGLLLACSSGLVGCTSPTIDLDTPDHEMRLRQDRLQAEQGNGEQHISLTLENAMSRGLAANLDARVAALEILVGQSKVTIEKLKALPAISASRGYVGRDNNGASSSRSVLSGLQSLEPSQSTDRERQVAALEANWNLIDIALAYADARKAGEEARIAAERHEKVIQNIQRDVYAAYWRAYAYQETATATRELLALTRAQTERLNQAVRQKLLSADAAADQTAQLADRARTLRELDDRLSLAQTELKSMLSLPLAAGLKLARPELWENGYRPLLQESLEAQEWEALKNRPEVREEILQKNVTLRDTKREVLMTLPGFELFAGLNYDDNSFLEDSTWGSTSLKIVQSLLSVVTLPARFEAAKKKEALADARRQALVAAVLAQTVMARLRLQAREDAYRDQVSSMAAAAAKVKLMSQRTHSGLSSGQTLLQARLENQIEQLRGKTFQAELQDAYAAYMNTLGRRFFRPLSLMPAEAGL